MRVGVEVVSRLGMLPVVKIQTDGQSFDTISKALSATAIALEKQHASKAKDKLFRQNPAARRLVHFVDESYNMMVDSLAKQIQKVLEEG